MNISLQSQYRAARITADLIRLVTLDKVWTSYLNKVKSIPTQDVVSLQDLTNEMRQLLILLPSHAAWLQQQIEDKGAEFESELERLINDTGSLEQHSKERVRYSLTKPEGVTTLKAKLNELVESSDSEISTITSKMKTISNNGFVPGDLGFLCAVGAALTVAGALTLDAPAAGVGLIVVAAEC